MHRLLQRVIFRAQMLPAGFLVLVGSIPVLLSGCGPVELSETDELFKAGARIVWIRQVGAGSGDDVFCTGENLVLMGLDINGERRLLPEVGSFRKPLIIPDGSGVVFSRYTDQAFYYVNWDGSGLRKLGSGNAAEVWRDPNDECVWIYYMVGDLVTTAFQSKPVMRCRLDDPSITELVWDKTIVSTDNFQLSADGTKAAGLFPWSLAGIVDLPGQTLHRMGKGCWASMSPDNRYLMWLFDGAHKNLMMRSLDGSISQKVRINTMPGSQKHEVYHPRWGNHPQFFSVTGPYRQMGEYNAITGGGEGINLYVGKFDSGYRRVEKWYQITENALADFYPDLWLPAAYESEHTEDQGKLVSGEEPLIKEAAVWPAGTKGLRYVWRDGKSVNGIKIPGGGYQRCNVVRKGKAKYGRFHEMQLAADGYFLAEGDAPLTDAVLSNRAFTVLLNIRPSLEQSLEAGVILAKGNMALVQVGSGLMLKVGSGSALLLKELIAGQDQFITLTCDVENGFRLYYQGLVHQPADIVPADSDVFHEFGTLPLTFGARENGREGWAGSIDGIAWFDRALTPAEVQMEYAAYIAMKPNGREKEVSRTILDARLVEISPMPSPEAIAPYRAALVEYLYEVVRIIEGHVEQGQLIVQHWAVLDAVAYPLDRKKGEVYRLVLESIEDHPELEGERISSELIEPVDIYLDVGSE